MMEIINKNEQNEKDHKIILNVEDINPILRSNDNPIQIDNLTDNIMRINTQKTEYFSVNSEPVVIEVENSKRKDTSYDDISSCDSFDSFTDENLNNYQFDNEYELMREFIRNQEFDKMRELDKKIVQKEITIRKAENKRRLERLKKLEEKLMAEVKGKNFDKENNFLGNKNTMYLNLPNLGNDKSKSKPKLSLVNPEKDGGYLIYTEDEIENLFDEQKFCDLYFYTKK